MSNEEKILAILQAVQANVTTMQASMTTMQADITSMQGDITTMRADITSMQGDITTMRADITSMQGDMTAMRADITTMQGDITTMRADITSMENRMDKLETKVDRQKKEIIGEVKVLMESYFDPKFNALADKLSLLEEKVLPVDALDEVHDRLDVLEADVKALKKAQ